MKLLECKCEHEYQTKKYGGRRLHNQSGKDITKYKCTVCGNVKTQSRGK